MRTPPMYRQVAGTLALGAALGIGWLIGKSDSPRLQAAPPVPAAKPAEESDYSKRVVAYIFGTIPITREELGEYLIARYGAEKLDLLINKRIIEHECEKKGIKIGSHEIEADFELLARNVAGSKKTFVDMILKEYRKTEYEWKEDVVRPRLMLAQFCKDRIQVTDEDLQKAFESNYGEKVDVQIIVYPGHLERQLGQLYDRVRQSEETFNEEARRQPDPKLASAMGRVKPICRHTGLAEIEKTAFALKPGQISHAIQVPEGFLIMRCVGRIPPDPTAKLDDKREELRQQVMERKLQQEIPVAFRGLKEDAKPTKFLVNERATRAEADRDSDQLINGMPKR